MFLLVKVILYKSYFLFVGIMLMIPVDGSEIRRSPAGMFLKPCK